MTTLFPQPAVSCKSQSHDAAPDYVEFEERYNREDSKFSSASSSPKKLFSSTSLRARRHSEKFGQWVLRRSRTKKAAGFEKVLPAGGRKMKMFRTSSMNDCAFVHMEKKDT